MLLKINLLCLLTLKRQVGLANPTLSQTITAKAPITAELWQTFMGQLDEVNQNNKLLKKEYKKKVQQNQAYTAKAKSSSQDANSKANKTEQNQARGHNIDIDKTAQPAVQAISASQVVEQESNYESESDHDQLDLDLLLNMEGDNE